MHNFDEDTKTLKNTMHPDASLCWKVDYPTKEVMYRCIPCADPSQADCTPEKVYQTKCVSTADSSDTSIVAGDVACRGSPSVGTSRGRSRFGRRGRAARTASSSGW